MKITSVIISFAYTRFMKISRENALSWSQSVLFFLPLHFPTPTAPFPLSSPSLSPSASFLSQTWILASERKCKWNVRRKEEAECYGFETSWQNTAAHVGGHFIENKFPQAAPGVQWFSSWQDCVVNILTEYLTTVVNVNYVNGKMIYSRFMEHKINS